MASEARVDSNWTKSSESHEAAKPRSAPGVCGLRDRRPRPARRHGRSDCAPPGSRTRIRPLRRRWPIHWASGAESREGIKPSRGRVAIDAPLRGSARGADSGNRTRIVSLEGWGPTVGRCPRGGVGESCTRIARVQAGNSPVELRPRRARRNRTFSLGFGGPAGHHDSAPQFMSVHSLVSLGLRTRSSATRGGEEVIAP